MKKFPRIARLSTLNIVRHQNFDYEFNPFRTDFVGEGGAGKSMIGDLLQLICVGVKAFRSPTKSTGLREPKTMVLRSDGNGTDFGYAFINIEVNTNEYLVIGIYLESSGNASMFIVQKGYSFDTDSVLEPFLMKLGVEDFINDNMFLPLAELKNHLQDTVGLTCESWERTNPYHKILYHNEILPIDLSSNSKTLENYAKIIQAFSRESLDINKSEKLQTFLFGDHKEGEFVKGFYNAIAELSDDLKQFDHNLEEITELKSKQMDLRELLDQKRVLEETLEIYLTEAYKYYCLEIIRIENELVKDLARYYDTMALLPNLKDGLSQKASEVELSLKELDKQWSEALEAHNLWRERDRKQGEFAGWLTGLGISEEELLAFYQQYQLSKTRIEKRRILEQKLEAQKGVQMPEQQIETGIVLLLTEQIRSYEADIKFKNRLLSLNNINEAGSLARWALDYDGAITKVQEGVIRKFHDQNYKVTQPKDKALIYLPDPLSVLAGLTQVKADEEGYWLELNGIYEYITTDFEPIFDKNKEEIRAYFDHQSVSLQSELISLERHKDNAIRLKAIFESLDNPDSYAEAWYAEIGLCDQLETLPVHAMEPSEFMEHHKFYQDRLNIITTANAAASEYGKLDRQRSSLKTLGDNIERKLKSFNSVNHADELLGLEEKYDIVISDSGDLMEALSSAEDYIAAFEKLYDDCQRSLSLPIKIRLLNDSLSKAIAERDRILVQSPEHLRALSIETTDGLESVRDLEAKYKSALETYNVTYNTLCRTYLKNRLDRFENTNDFKGLCYEILPSGLFDETNLEQDIIEMISLYLTEINLKNKRLNHRKLMKLQQIIDKLQEEVSEQIGNVKFIKGFLNEKDKIITGDLKVAMEELPGLFDHGWMKVFLDNIGEDLRLGGENSLFESLRGLSSDLENYPTLEEKLREAYYKSGGSRSDRPKIEQLLNPKSYYGLKFSIKNKDGQKNDGSTSQAYSAIALLCMAKLRLIDLSQNNGKIRGAIRFMAIDEAEGLGGNFEMLHKIAKDNDYQILSLSISPNKVDPKNQHIYLLQNSSEDVNVNYDPVPIFGSANIDVI